MISKMVSIFTRLATLILAAYIGVVGWIELGPGTARLGLDPEQVAKQIAAVFKNDLREESSDLGPVVLLPFQGDSDGKFTRQLRSAIQQSQALELRDRSLAEKVRDFLNIGQPTAPSQEVAIQWAKNRGAEKVLYGQLVRSQSEPEGGVLDVVYKLVDVRTGQTIHSERSEGPSTGSGEETPTEARFAWLQRGLGWLVMVLLMPVFTIGFLRTMVARKSNMVNAFLLTIYTVVAAILGYLLVGQALTGTLSIALFLLALVGAFAYNVQMMSFALKLEEE